MKKQKLLFFLLILIGIVGVTVCVTKVSLGSVVKQTDDGMAMLDIMPQKLFEIANVGDTVMVITKGCVAKMPLVDEIIAEDGKLQLLYDTSTHSINLCVYNQKFCDVYAVSDTAKVVIIKV